MKHCYMRLGAVLTLSVAGCVYAPGAESFEEDAGPPAVTPKEPGAGGWGDDETEAGAETDETEGFDDEDGFIPSTDAASPNLCDPWVLGGCPEGEKCAVYSPGGELWASTRCVPIAEDPKGPDEPCSYVGDFHDGVDDCVAGAVCWDVMLLQGGEVGTCVPFCVDSNNPHCEDDDARICNLNKSAGMGLCLPKCDPIASDCPAGCTCVSDSGAGGFLCVPDASGDEGQFMDPCMYANSCDPGLFCAAAAFLPACDDSSGCCAPFCSVDEPQPCTELGLECIPWWEQGAAPPGWEHIGGCGLTE